MAIQKDNEDIESILSKNTSWTTTYGDLMSSLMILFLALFSFYMTTNFGRDAIKTKLGDVREKPQAKFEEIADAPLKRPYVEVNLKEPILLRYEKGKVKAGLKETMAQIEEEIIKAHKVNFEGEMNKPTRKGLYPANWVRKVTINISPDVTDKAEYYVVKEGDSLWAISQKYMKDPIFYDELAKINKISDPATIHKGDILIIPKTETIKKLKKERRGDPPIVKIAQNIREKIFRK